METIAQLVSTLGFPIAVCVYMFWSQEKERETHKEETAKLTEALNNNTLVIQSLKDAIDHLTK
jgi:hypothetical protein